MACSSGFGYAGDGINGLLAAWVAPMTSRSSCNDLAVISQA
jgi:hypothetical protein